MSEPTPSFVRHFSSSILLWVRQDQPRAAGMAHWRGPHSGIIAATPGLHEYRQVHLAADNPGRWAPSTDIETEIPSERKIDGIAEVTFQSALAPLRGRAQTQLAYKDEVNVFRRTLLYAGAPGTSRWYDVGGDDAHGAESSVVLYLRRRKGAQGFGKFVRKTLVPALAPSDGLAGLRSQTFLPWSERMWDTPDVAHDNPLDQRFHASVMLAFADEAARSTFLANSAELNEIMRPKVSAVHAYDVETTLTFVKDGEVLAEPQEN
ncbi:hypothetical protein SAMN04489867_3461 [Pedococcus dokdonensis]|uniref:Strictosidine synthase n=1 Tax=Pedococcus dokdonensis TaxID=443156 RepID=A0A1H0URW9_9MICO|nr:strictosidine synthase [Pedococcus dokdonensis]SDP68556.1 hypothetical protein SAMN04489867_3461 [Pedococcus dokdonensis]